MRDTSVSIWVGYTEAGERNISCPLCFADTQRDERHMGVHLRHADNGRMRLLCPACGRKHAPYAMHCLTRGPSNDFDALMTPTRPARFELFEVVEPEPSPVESVDVEPAPPAEPI